MNKKIIVGGSLVALIVIIGIGVLTFTSGSDESESNNQEEVVNQDDQDGESENEESDVMDGDPSTDNGKMDVEGISMDDFQFQGSLVDVTATEDPSLLLGVQTEGNATGEAKYKFANGEYTLLATFENLPEPSGDNFYEGWIVRPEPFDFISTGELTIEDGQYVNKYMTSTDYSDYNRYVLTIEPNDGDPAPAGHILEGDMDQKASPESNSTSTANETVGGVYENYSEDKIQRAANGDVVIFFHASWCSTCKVADSNINDNLDQIPSDLTILKADYDSSTDLRQKYGVTTQHTFVKVDESGNKVRQMGLLSSVSAIADFAKDE
jgi:thioredoxin 1